MSDDPTIDSTGEPPVKRLVVGRGSTAATAATLLASLAMPQKPRRNALDITVARDLERGAPRPPAGAKPQWTRHQGFRERARRLRRMGEAHDQARLAQYGVAVDPDGRTPEGLIVPGAGE